MYTSLFSNTKFRLAFIVVITGWAILQAWLVTLFGFSWIVASKDSLIGNAILIAGFFLIANTLRFYLPEQNRYIYLSALVVFIGFLWLMISSFLLFFLMYSNPDYQDFYIDSLAVRAAFGLLLIITFLLMHVLWYSIQQQELVMKRDAEAQKLATDAELYRIREQLKPHFLFNSLNSIQALIGQDPKKARIMVQQLSDFLRNTIRGDEKQWFTLQQELEILNLYLEIEKVRFGHRLNTELRIPDEVLSLQIPALLLQPVLENAIKFGLYDTLDDVIIRIEAGVENHILWVRVANPYDAETGIRKKGTGYGLNSVKRRLDLVFNRKDLLQTSREENIFITKLLIPQPT